MTTSDHAGKPGSTRKVLSGVISVTLSLSDWLLLSGWASAHLTDTTPAQIEAALHQIGRQVMDS